MHETLASLLLAAGLIFPLPPCHFSPSCPVPSRQSPRCPLVGALVSAMDTIRKEERKGE